MRTRLAECGSNEISSVAGPWPSYTTPSDWRPNIGAPELIIIAVIVVLLFGTGKLADVGGSLGRSIREFRNATQEDDEPAKLPTAPLPPPDVHLQAPNGTVRFCAECGSGITTGQKFCGNCGAATATPASQ